MVDINPGIDIAHHITWELVINRALFDTTQQRQQKCHTTLNDLEKATKQLYNCSIAAKVLENQRR